MRRREKRPPWWWGWLVGALILLAALAFGAFSAGFEHNWWGCNE
jgi:hypothetical protein